MFGLLVVGRVPLLSGRYWDRTSDPFHVKEVRYRCANRPFSYLVFLLISVMKFENLSRWRRDLNPCSGICSPEPRLSATPPNR